GAGADDLLDSQALEIGHDICFARPVDLVHDEKYRLARLERHLCDAAVFVGDHDVGLGNDPDDIGTVGGLDDLFLDGELKVVHRVLDAGGDYHPKVLALEFGLGHGAVAGSTGFVGYDSFAPFQDGVKQAGLANVCTANNGYNRKRLVLHLQTLYRKILHS